MKAIIAAIFLIGTTICVRADLTDDQKQKLGGYYKICIDESGVDENLVKKARQGSFSDDTKLKSFAFCMSEKVGFQNHAGNIQADVVKEKLAAAIADAAVADELITLCLTPKSTPEETAFETFKCYYEHTPTHIAIF